MYDPERLSPGPSLNRSEEAFKVLTQLEDAYTEVAVLEETGGLDLLIDAKREEIVEIERRLSRVFGISNNEMRIHAVVGRRRLNNVLTTMKYVNTAKAADESEYISPRPPRPEAKPDRRQPKLWNPSDFVVHQTDLDD